MRRRGVGAEDHAHEVKALRGIDEGRNDSDDEDENDERATQVSLGGQV